jgi:hypothetical protein
MFPKKSKTVGKKREPLKQVKQILDKKNVKETKKIWPLFGQKERYNYLFKKELSNRPLAFLKKRFVKKKPKIIFLGAGKGNYISLFKKELIKNKINPVIDVFSLTETLSQEAKKEVNKDYSRRIPFEHLNSKLSQSIKLLQEEFKHKYDLIISPMGVGFHTMYPANALFTSAMMLKIGGRAFIEVDNLRTADVKHDLIVDNFLSSLKESNISSELKSYIYTQKQIDNIVTIFMRFVNAYNAKAGTNLRFSVNKQNYVDKSKFAITTTFFEIERIT